MFVVGANSPSGYFLTRSLRFRASASAYLNRTPAGAGNRKTWTWSAWVKRGALGANRTIFNCDNGTTDATFGSVSFINTDGLQFAAYNTVWRTSTQVFRDPAAWYHIVVAFDTTQATAANRIKMYVNGVQITAFSISNDPTLNTDYAINQAAVHSLGNAYSSYGYLDGYLAEVNFIDGQALTPSSFGSTNALTGVWQPAAYTGTYGTNGFYLPFTDNSALTTSSNVGLGKDFSGNGNYWTTNNISITAGVTYDSMTDVPTLTGATAANFAVMNPLNFGTACAPTPMTAAGGNLNWSYNRSSSGSTWMPGTIQVPPNSKIYFEFVQTSASSAVGASFGICYTNLRRDSANPTIWRTINAFNGNKFSDTVNTAYGTSFAVNDICGVAVDLVNGKIFFSKNGTWQGSADPVAGTNAAFTDLVSSGYSWLPVVYGSGGDSNAGSANFGQRPFAYTPPTGFVALNTFNLPTATILKGNTVMDVTTYTGNGTSLSVTNAAGFKPDFVWVKSRASTFSHYLSDSVRGVGRAVFSNLVNAESVDADQLTAFNSNGFSVGPNAGMNTSGNALVGAQWQAGQGSSSSNTNGSITSTVSVNAASGFSVVTYTGTGANATVGHGLGIAPSMIFIKQRNSASTNWRVYSSATGNTGATFLDLTNAFVVASTYWNNTSPTSSVFSLGTNGDLNASGGTYVAYCWSQIEGFSKVGSYTGNASTDGTFVYLGFRPKYIMVKRTDSAENWYWWDSIRNPYNAVNADLYPNLTNAEDTGTIRCDFLSNGFKLRSSGSPNASGGTFMYMAFAENPTKYSLAR